MTTTPTTHAERLLWLAKREVECPGPPWPWSGHEELAEKDEICPTCKGTGKVPQFPTLRQKCRILKEGIRGALKGSGIDPDAKCPLCEGRGWVLPSPFPFEELLIEAEAKGFITGLVSDDAGHWAAIGDGTQPVHEAGKAGIPWTAFDLSEAHWEDSPGEALSLALYEALNPNEEVRDSHGQVS